LFLIFVIVSFGLLLHLWFCRVIFKYWLGRSYLDLNYFCVEWAIKPQLSGLMQFLAVYLVRRGRLGVQLVLPPTDEAPYYLRKGAGDIVSAGKSADGKKPATKEESDEDEDSD